MSKNKLTAEDAIILKDSQVMPPLSGLEAYSEFERLAKECLGEVLTVIDASLPEERQNKAMKDVIKKIVHRMLSESQSFCSRMDKKDGATWGGSINL